MGMGAATCSADVISFENVEKLVPAEFKKLKTLLFTQAIELNVDAWKAFAYCVQYNCLEIEEIKLQFGPESENAARNLAAQLQNAWDCLAIAFNVKTGLSLTMCSYNEEEGDRYDDVPVEHGCFFCVDGVWERTPAGEKYKDYIQHGSWTVYC